MVRAYRRRARRAGLWNLGSVLGRFEPWPSHFPTSRTTRRPWLLTSARTPSSSITASPPTHTSPSPTSSPVARRHTPTSTPALSQPTAHTAPSTTPPRTGTTHLQGTRWLPHDDDAANALVVTETDQ